MTKNIPEDEQLFVGLTKIAYEDELKNDPYEDHLETTKEEVEAALYTEPNGSLFGSSYIKSLTSTFWYRSTRPTTRCVSTPLRRLW